MGWVMKEVGRGGRSGPGTCVSEAAMGHVQGFPTWERLRLPTVPGRAARPWVSHPASSGPRLLPARAQWEDPHPGLVGRWRTDSVQ